MKIVMAVSRSTARTVWGSTTAVVSESSSTVHAKAPRLLCSVSPVPRCMQRLHDYCVQ
jgi:hypothetical protein